MIRWIGRILFLALTVVLVIWVCQGLLGVDQTSSIIPGFGADSPFVIMAGVFWGLLLLAGAGNFVAPRIGNGRVTGRAGQRLSAVGVGTIVEVDRTGVTINDVPQYDVFVRVAPPVGDEFVSQLRTLLDAPDAAALVPGSPFPVRYDPNNQDAIGIADPNDPAVRYALLEWRIAQGLIDPRLIGARTRGVSAPASVLAMRPTGNQRAGQVELTVRLLVAPPGQQTWEADTTVFVYPQALSHVQVGSPVFAMYEPHDRSAVAMTITREDARA